MIYKIWTWIISFFDTIRIFAAGTIAIIALLSLHPPFAKALKFHYAKNLNPTGYMRYKVNEKYEPYTDKGQLRAVKAGDRSFNALKAGDILQVVSLQNFRETPDLKTGTLLQLRIDDCVMVVKKEKAIDEYDGWVKVVTTSCGFFQ